MAKKAMITKFAFYFCRHLVLLSEFYCSEYLLREGPFTPLVLPLFLPLPYPKGDGFTAHERSNTNCWHTQTQTHWPKLMTSLFSPPSFFLSAPLRSKDVFGVLPHHTATAWKESKPKIEVIQTEMSSRQVFVSNMDSAKQGTWQPAKFEQQYQSWDIFTTVTESKSEKNWPVFVL